ncbi:site-specific integrase [Devosia sp. XK-2]|uniref:tyrosine-type recombinase/integrase n=1 Tax=Devosia sp. XK-2 TaxID=3126689 RepID=UPI0030CCF67B
MGDVIDDALLRITMGRRRVKGEATERLRLLAFKRDFPALCGTRLKDATEDMFDDWISERLEVVKPNTVRRDLALLKPIFSTAARRQSLQHSPLSFVKPPRAIDERIRRISLDEEVLLFDQLDRSKEPLVPIVAKFSLETGCRRSECLRLEWRDFDANGGTIWLADAKNGRGRYILLSTEAQRLVEQLSDRGSTDRIFPITGNLLKKAFENARSRAAKEAIRLGRPELASVASLRWHDFRHEAISRCFDAGWTSEQVMDFSGHVDTKSLLRYRHPRVSDSVARLRALRDTK